MSVLEEKNNELVLRIRLTPKSKKDGIDGEHDGRLKISVTSPPVEGKANDHLVRFLSKKLGIAKGRIRISSGETSRNKTLSLSDIEIAIVKKKLGL